MNLTRKESDMPTKEDLSKTFDRGVCIQVSIGTLGLRRKVDKEKIDVGDADKEMISVSKEILECPEYDSVLEMDREIKKYMAKKAIPVPIFIRSLYLVPTESVNDVYAELGRLQERREEAVATFVGVYEDAQKKAETRLGNLYDVSDYPPVSRIRSTFYVTTRPWEIGVSGKLKQINEKLFLKESEKLKKDFADAAAQIRVVLRSSLQELVTHLYDRLSGSSKDEKPKVFRDSAVKNIMEFIDSFDPKNVTNDAELKKSVDRCKKLLSGVDVKELRQDDSLKAQVAKDLSGIKDALDKLVVDAPSRKIKFSKKGG
jgi:hypothetical protein